MNNFFITKIKANGYSYFFYEGVAKFDKGVNILLGKNGSGKISIFNMINGVSGIQNPG